MLSYFNWTHFSYFYSAEHTRKFLTSCYERQQIEEYKEKGYENCYPFIYYLEHGKVYYEQAKSSPLLIQPILLYYGFVHLIKACILTVNPNYPEKTSVLAHGVSTRKRKKHQYQFFDDEVKVQKSGLFPFICTHLFQIEHIEGQKIKMGELLKQVPELNKHFRYFQGTDTFANIKQNHSEFYFPLYILDFFHMTENRFKDFFEKKSSLSFHFKRIDDNYIIFKKMSNSKDYTPLKFNLEENTFSLPLTNHFLFTYDEILIHYLLLYNLSMIARYETEWWSELIKSMPNKDFPFISSFLEITCYKSPFLVFEFLSKVL